MPSQDTYRDRQIVKLIADALRATGEFDEVRTAGLPEVQGSGSDEARLASLEIVSWDESDQFTDTDVNPLNRTVRFRLTILVRMEDPDMRDDECDRLYCASANAFVGHVFGGVTYSYYSRLNRGNWLPANPPERRMAVLGQFTYGITDFGTRNTQPD